MTVGDKIKALRKSKGLTQTELGEIVGVKKNAVSKWECGRVEYIPTSMIKALASLFNVPPSYLIDDDNTPNFQFVTPDFTEDKISNIVTHKVDVPPIASDKAINIVCKIDSKLYNDICSLAVDDGVSFESEMEHLLYWAAQRENERRKNIASAYYYPEIHFAKGISTTQAEFIFPSKASTTSKTPTQCNKQKK